MGPTQCDQIPPCFKDLQHLEQKGVVPPNLSSFGKKLAHMVTLDPLIKIFISYYYVIVI